MSVILFNATSFAQMFKAMKSRHDGPDTEKHYVACLLRISEANTNCFNYRYAGADETPVSEAELRAEIATTPYDLESAASTASMMHYNCCEDRDFLAELDSGLEALVRVQTNITRALLTRIEEMKTISPSLTPIAPSPVARSTPPATWARLPDGAWGAKATGARVGDVVNVKRYSDGRTTMARLVSEVKPGLFSVEK